jgi:hypothetical protein
MKQVLRRNEELEHRVRYLEKALLARTGRAFPASGTSLGALLACAYPPGLLTQSPAVGYDVDGLPSSRHAGDYSVPQAFGSPYLGAANPYDQWPSSVVPVPSAVTVNSVESSPGASGPGEDFTPAYVHTSVPLAEGAVIPSNTSAPSIGSAKSDYQELDAGMDHKERPQSPLSPVVSRLVGSVC